jgi:hypothetical protein
MRISSNYILNFRNLVVAACLVCCALNGAHAQTPAVEKVWTTVGSAGTADETAAGKIFFDHSVVQMGRLVISQTPAGKRALILPQTQSAVIRYNVTPVDGLFTQKQQSCTGQSCPALKLTLRFLRAGSSARVVANLIEVDLATGVETVRLTFNSNTFPAADRYQVKSGPSSCGPDFLFDFKRKAYYIEATLTGSSIAIGSAAGIQMIKIETDSCLG